jgi:hypothetical protein
MLQIKNTNLGALNGATASADGKPQYKIGGCTIDSAATIPTGTALTGLSLADNDFIPAGKKFFYYGAVLVKNVAGNYIPWDGAAALARGDVYIVNRTVKEDDDDFLCPGGCMEGGRVYDARLRCLAGGVWTALTAPQKALLYAAMPLIQPVKI